MKKRSGVMPVVVALAGVSLSCTSLFLAVNTGLIAVSSLVMWNVSHFVAVTVLLMIISTRDQLVHCGHHCCFDMVHHGIAYHSSCHWCFSVEDYGNSHWSSLNGTWKFTCVYKGTNTNLRAFEGYVILRESKTSFNLTQLSNSPASLECITRVGTLT